MKIKITKYTRFICLKKNAFKFISQHHIYSCFFDYGGHLNNSVVTDAGFSSLCSECESEWHSLRELHVYKELNVYHIFELQKCKYVHAFSGCEGVTYKSINLMPTYPSQSQRFHHPHLKKSHMRMSPKRKRLLKCWRLQPLHFALFIETKKAFGFWRGLLLVVPFANRLICRL